MGFLAPWLLVGLATLGLPVYLHLLRQHKTTPRPFSSLMFFERRIQSSIKHRRLKYRVLFALRALFLALLILAFARPAIESSGIASAHNGRVLALLIDDSFSMRQGDRLARAKQAALDTASGMRSADRAQVILFGGPTRLLTNLTAQRSEIEAAIRAIEPGDGTGSYAEVARAIRSLTQLAKSPVEAHLFSDMQKTGAPVNFSDLKLPEGSQLVLHPAADHVIPNFAVENVISPRRLFSAKSGRVQATVVSYSDRDTQKRVTVSLNDRQTETKSVTVPAGGRATVEFTGVDANYGLNRGEVRIDHSDEFPGDDHFYFAVERSDPAPALYVHDSQDARGVLYFKTALAANQPAFTLSESSYAQAESTGLDRFAFVVVENPTDSSHGLQDKLRRYEEHGGNVLVIFGRRGAAGTSAGEGTFRTIAQVDSTHPSLRFPARWDTVRFYRVATVPPGTARVLLRLDNGIPLLTELPSGEGRHLVLASALDNIENDLPVNPLFVPFVQQLTSYLGRVETATGNYTAGSFYDLRQAETKDESPIEVTGPKQERVLSLTESTHARGVPLEHQGFYDIRRQNGRHELAAVNPDRRESDFTLLPADTLALWKNTGTPAAASSSGSEATRQKNELWWWVLLAALALAVAESVLGNRHLEVKEGTS